MHLNTVREIERAIDTLTLQQVKPYIYLFHLASH